MSVTALAVRRSFTGFAGKLPSSVSSDSAPESVISVSQTRSNITNPSLLPSRKKKPKLNTPSLLLLNARSLTSKVGLLQVYVAHYNPSLIAVTESWANCTIPDSVYTLLGYSLYRNDRKNQAGGGVLLYVNNRLKSEINDDLTHSDYEESIWCNVWLTKDVKLLIGVVYRPPGLLPMQNQNLVNLLHKTRSYSKSEYTIVVGDFNYPSIDWERFSFSPSCDQFVDAVLDLNLTQHVLQPTRNDAILTLFFHQTLKLFLMWIFWNLWAIRITTWFFVI